jgi:predicted CopG family antitoxin
LIEKKISGKPIISLFSVTRYITQTPDKDSRLKVFLRLMEKHQKNVNFVSTIENTLSLIEIEKTREKRIQQAQKEKEKRTAASL